MEIERKYLLKSLPSNLEQYDHMELEQGYLCTNPVVRVRREDDQYILTYKGKGLLCREEANLPLTAEGYAHLREKADGIIIRKTRYLIPLDGKEVRYHTDGSKIHSGTLAELDVFHGEYEGLTLVEVEFDSVEQANAFVPPEWFGEDVSETGLYQNSRLAEKKQEF